MPGSHFGRRAALLGAAVVLTRPALAQRAWPAGRPIEIVVPFAPGGGMDVMARTVAPFLVARLPGARVVVINRPGAGGQLGTEAVANAAPDGFTLGACATPTVLSQPIERPVRWRPAELTYLAQVVEDPCGLFVRPDSPLQGLPDIPTYREGGVDVVFSAGRGIFGPPGLPEGIRAAIEGAFEATFADPAWAEAAARAGLPLKPLVGAAYREAALGGEAALRALWSRRPWKE